MRAAARRFLLVIILLTMSPTSTEARSEESRGEPRLSIDRLYSLPHLIGTEPRGFAWSADGRHLAFLWNDSGFNFRDVWTIDIEDPELTPVQVTSMPQSKRPDRGIFEAPLDLAQAEESWEREPGVTSVSWHPDGGRLLVSFGGDLWHVKPKSDPRRLTDTPLRETKATYSPDGEILGYLRAGDLWMQRPSSPPARQTEIAEPGLEVADFLWSPDGSQVAILLRDERRVARRGIPDYLAEETILTEVRRAYPGEPPVEQRLGFMDGSAPPTRPQRVRWIDWGPNEPDMILSYRWSPDGRWIAIDTSDLYAKDRQVWVVDLETDDGLSPRLIARDQDPLNETFYFWRIEWSADSQRLYFLSDREQDYHVWAVSPGEPSQPQQLTRGSWAVAEIFPVADGLIVVGNLGNAEERHLFFVDESGGRPLRLSRQPGTHSPTLSPDGQWAAVHFSSQGMPPELFLTALERPSGNETDRDSEAARGEAHRRHESTSETLERRVTHSPVAEFGDYKWVEAQFVSFPSHVDGTTLYGRLTLPPDFDPDESYPAILGSVYTDSVRNQWGGRTAHPTWGLDQYLAQEGYILLNVDMRGSWGRGREHRRGIRLDYGGMDIEDLESGVRHLGRLGYVDLDRIGIWGSSYGGLMTAMSLFRKPGLYAAGIAGAPATNVWHALTGQMAVMMRPQDQPEEYADSSPVIHAHGLEDPLMIIHGMRDRVVLFKDSVTLVQRLILLGKNVELVTLPNAGHGWDAEGLAQTRFAFGKMIEFFDRHLSEPCTGCRD